MASIAELLLAFKVFSIRIRLSSKRKRQHLLSHYSIRSQPISKHILLLCERTASSTLDNRDGRPHNTWLADRIFTPFQEPAIMRIIFYKSKLCPRCYVAGKHLLALCSKIPDLQVEEVELLTSPLRTWQDGIRMVPALKIGDVVLSGIYLSQESITDFVAQMTGNKQ